MNDRAGSTAGRAPQADSRRRAAARPAARRFDVLCMGRAAVDLYGEQIGARLEDVTTFARYLGGSPANTAVGCARLGLQPAMLTRVGDEQNGNFVRETLAREGVDVTHVTTDPARLTALVFLSVRAADNFPLLFYRDRCADMGLAPEHIDPAFVAQCGALLLSGTHLSQNGTRAAIDAAIVAARAAGTRIALDIDYRPVLWGLRRLGDGATRYIEARHVSEILQARLPHCDLVVGTEEEIQIAGGSPNLDAALATIRGLTRALVVMKRGADGCTLFAPDAPPQPVAGFPIDVFNVLGAGDAFMAGFLSAWLRGMPGAECARRANACGALVVSRHGCAPAMATREELEHFLAHGSAHRRLREDAGLERLHRATTRRPAPAAIAALAFDHRSQFEDMMGRDADAAQRIARFKQLVAQAALSAVPASPTAVCGGVLVDDRYGAAALPALDALWVARPVEEPGSRPLRFEGGASAAALLRSWPAQHVAKCLVAYHPDDTQEMRAAQIERLRELAQACADTQRELLLEVIPPGETDDAVLLRAVADIAGAGVLPDWWKLQAPLAAGGWRALETTIRGADPQCRGVLVLGLDAPLDELAERLAAAAREPLCRGFAVGRTIFGDAARAWMAGTLDDAGVVATIAARYRRLVDAFSAARCAAPAGAAAAPAVRGAA